MRKVELGMNETYKYEIIKKLYDTNGNKKAAAIKLKCSVRNINRLLVKYKEEGKASSSMATVVKHLALLSMHN